MTHISKSHFIVGRLFIHTQSDLLLSNYLGRLLYEAVSMGMAVSCHSYILPLEPLIEGLFCPIREGAGPITEPGGRDAGIRARTGASTIFILLLLILLLYFEERQHTTMD